MAESAVNDLIDAEIDRAVSGIASRGRAPSFREFFRTMTYDGGDKGGERCDPDSDPSQRYLIDQMDSKEWSRIFWRSIPQGGGKTLVCVTLPICCCAIAGKMSVGYALPTARDIDKAYANKLRQSLCGSGYGDYWPTSGGGSKKGRPDVLRFADPSTGDDLGSITFCPGGAYGDTTEVMVVDELDMFRDQDGTPWWSDIEDLWARCDSYLDSALRLGVGTIEDDHASVICHYTEVEGTGTRLWPRCPYCARFGRISWSDVCYDGGSLSAVRETAGVVCPGCGVKWSRRDRQRALHDGHFVHRGQSVEDGRVVGDVPDTDGTLGLITPAWDSTRTDLGEVAVRYVRARAALESRGDHEPIRKWTRYQSCECYHGDRQDDDDDFRVTPDMLSRKFYRSGNGPVQEDRDEGGARVRYYVPWPEWADGAVLEADVQGNRIYTHVDAYSTETWRRATIEWGYEITRKIEGRPEDLREDDVIDLLERIDCEVPALWGTMADCVAMRIVDTGYLPDSIAKFLRANEAWRGIVGVGHLSRGTRMQVAELIGWDPQWRPGLGRYEIVTESARERFHAALGREVGSRLSHVLPAGLKPSSHLLRHVAAWRLETNPRTHRTAWRKYQRRDDWCDLPSYGEAMISRLQARMERSAGGPKTTMRPGVIGRVGV